MKPISNQIMIFINNHLHPKSTELNKIDSNNHLFHLLSYDQKIFNIFDPINKLLFDTKFILINLEANK